MSTTTAAELKYKEGDEPRFVVQAQTTDRLLVFGTNGRFYTLGCDRLPGGRGHGEPVRLMIDLGNEHDIVAARRAQGRPQVPGGVRAGRGFVVPEDEVVAQTKTGKQVLNLADKEKAQAFAVVPADADRSRRSSDNRKLLIFPLDQVPEMGARPRRDPAEVQGRRLSDAQAFRLAEACRGPTAIIPASELKFWRGERAQAGRMPEKGWPRAKRFKD